jgi:hypothetical protein
VAAALNRTDRDRIGDQPRLEARFDCKKAGQLAHAYDQANVMPMAQFRRSGVDEYG